MTEASFYPGDLLRSVVQLDDVFWNSRHDNLQAMRQIIAKLQATRCDEDVRFALEAMPTSLSGSS